MSKRKGILAISILIFSVLIFTHPFWLRGYLPIPADTIIGLYHPFRDLYAQDYPRGIPFKNFLITDSVRQLFPWRMLVLDLWKQHELPLWNPYNLSGTPLLANFQSAVFYFLNILFFIFPFSEAWSILVFSQPLLAGLFLFFYLRNLNINYWGSLLSALAYAFSGFSISWLEWNTIGHTALWLPLILLSIDKIILQKKDDNAKINPSSGGQKSNVLVNFKKYAWPALFVIALSSSFFAGHLQTFFYLFGVQFVYYIARWFQKSKSRKLLVLFVCCYLLFIILTAVQWIPTYQFISYSARSIDLNWQQEGWFIPWQNLLQFIIPDFFGNPTTLNYWGVWNYGEFIGYIGILPLIMASYAIFFRYDRKTLFFGSLFFLSLLFSLPTIFAKLPYLMNIPFLSTAQPTRLIFIAVFALCVLAGLGMDHFAKNNKKIIIILFVLGSFFLLVWLFIIFSNKLFSVSAENLAVTRRNSYLPLLTFLGTSVLLLIAVLQKKKSSLIIILLIATSVFDLLRFSFKFTPFTNRAYLFPDTQTTGFLRKHLGNYRIMSTDSRILPPNFSLAYRLQSIDGYDPLYLLRYGELIAASERGTPNISPPFGFNRIITPQNLDSKIIDLLGVKYILSLSDLSFSSLKKVHVEGQTQVYENLNVLPRVFFVESIEVAADNKEAIKKMFAQSMDFKTTAIIEPVINDSTLFKNIKLSKGKVSIISYKENEVIIRSENDGEGFIVFTDSYYPSWLVAIDGKKSIIYRTDYNFRGVFVSPGTHTIKFNISII